MAEQNKKSKGEQDTPQDLAQITEQHGTDILGLDERMKKIEDQFGDNEKIADTLVTVAENIKNFDQLFEKAFVLLIKNSTDVKGAFQVFVDEGDRIATNKLIKRFGVVALWFLSLVVTVVVTAVITKKIG